MGIQAIILALKNNKRTKRNQFDKNKVGKGTSNGDFVDNRKTNTYEDAAFQKKIFEEKRRRKQKYYFIIFLTAIGIIILFFIILAMLNLIFNPAP
tara:strand:- start:67 stop:351 length:285 start_codon:yes stop_codon:yes gene_type:complete